MKKEQTTFFHSLPRHLITDSHVDWEYCLGLWHQVWFIGAVLSWDNSRVEQPGVMIINSSDHDLLSPRKVLDATEAGKVVPLTKKFFGNLRYDDEFFFTARHKDDMGVHFLRKYVSFQPNGIGIRQLPSSIAGTDFGTHELVYVPVL